MITSLQKLFLFILFLFFAVTAYFILFVSLVSAQATGVPQGLELNGYAWSENIGWISLNCLTGGTGQSNICSISNYKVSVSSNGTLNGYAWSPNIGWIRFNFNSISEPQYPSGRGTVAESASLNGTYPNFSSRGWIRACAGTDSNDWCGNTNINPMSGNWDGWISLRGTGDISGISEYGFTTGNFGSPQYVWGGDVIGWVDFSSHLTFYEPPNITGLGCTIPDGQGSCNGNLTWTMPDNLVGQRVVKSWPQPVTELSTNRTGTNFPATLVYGSNIFAIRGTGNTDLARWDTNVSCQGANSAFNTTSGTCEPASVDSPNITLRANPPIVRRGASLIIEWTIQGLNPADGSCTIIGPGINQTVTTTGSETVVINNVSRYVMRCEGNFPTVEQVINASVLPSVIEI